MSAYSLKIAGYVISFHTDEDNVSLVPSQSQESFICDISRPGLAINVFRKKIELPAMAVKVFSAPYVEEVNDRLVEIDHRFWTVYNIDDNILVHTFFPSMADYQEALVIIPSDGRDWEIEIDTPLKAIDPFTYPLDGLILYYLTALKGDIFIHGSSVRYGDKGILFTGPSGSGKSTIAKLFGEAGAEIIHDDRVIIKENQGVFTMYNTPVYPDEKDLKCDISELFLIGHGEKNQAVPVHGSVAVASVLSNCIQHHWNSGHIDRLTGIVSRLTEAIPVRLLQFVPDHTIVDFITRNDG